MLILVMNFLDLRSILIEILYVAITLDLSFPLRVLFYIRRGSLIYLKKG